VNFSVSGEKNRRGNSLEEVEEMLRNQKFCTTRKLWKITDENLGQADLEQEDMVIREYNLKVFLNSREVTTLTCSPVDLEYLVVGFLFAEGFIERKGDLQKIAINEEKGIVEVETRRNPEVSEVTPSRASYAKHSDLRVGVDTIFRLAAQLQEKSRVFRETGGVHSAGVADGEEIIVFHEDIGRYNALDKVTGRCLLEEIPLQDKIIIFSGRVPSKVVQKVARMGARILVAVSAPTDLGIELAEEAGITLIGFARNQRMNIYTHPQRIVFSNL